MKVSQHSAFLVLSFFTISSLALAQSTYDESTVKERIVAGSQMAGQESKTSANDLKVTSRIRKDILKEKNFSTGAQNVQIQSVNGTVTLRGQVESAREQNSILKHARAAAGVSNVINEIEIVPESKQ